MDADTLRAWVGSWPGVTDDIKWGNDLVFSVGAKMFCATDVTGTGGLGFKVDAERFLELTDRPGFAPAKYLARAHWVDVAKPDALPAEELRALLRRSYELVRAKLTKTQQREFAD